MSCCAIGKCGRVDQLTGGPGMVRNDRGLYDCWLCYRMPYLFAQPPKKRNGQFVHDEDDDHRGMKNPTQDGFYDILTGKSHDPTWERRNRDGPHR